jgi:hypothetical protein
MGVYRFPYLPKLEYLAAEDHILRPGFGQRRINEYLDAMAAATPICKGFFLFLKYIDTMSRAHHSFSLLLRSLVFYVELFNAISPGPTGRLYP